MRSIVELVISLTRVGSCIRCSIWNRLKHAFTGFDVVPLTSPDASQLKSPVTIGYLHSHDTLSMISPSLSIKLRSVLNTHHIRVGLTN